MSSKSPSPTLARRRQPSQRRRRSTLRAQDTSGSTPPTTKRLRLTYRASARGDESPDPIDDIIRLPAGDSNREKDVEVEVEIEEEGHLAEC